ncbi:hypothetical protein F5Y03DRAFT_79881 [Xylaria venustula]|nr:hypothetical protein F5Y03DRAFT_79881 [Xylaria venustula]
MNIHSIPWSTAAGRKGNLPLVLLAVTLLPATAYSAYVLRQSARWTTARTRISPPDPLRIKADVNADDGDGRNYEEEEEKIEDVLPASICADINTGKYVVARERIVSEAVPLRQILPGLLPGLSYLQGERGKEWEQGANGDTRGLLETYLATTMRTFTWTPQAFIMKLLVSRLPGGQALARTFSTEYLDECRFAAGDRVCGVYVVRERVHNNAFGDAQKSGENGRGERILLDLSAPEGWTGPVVSGALDCGYVLSQENEEAVVRFVNETVLWRAENEKPTLLEGAVSRWMHGAMVRWMVVRGVEAVTRG